MNTFKAEKRDLAEKAKKLRREGFVTGNVFGRDLAESIPVKFARIEAERLMRENGKGSRVILEIAGEPMNVLVKEIDYDSLKRQILEMDFQVLVQNEMVKSVAEIVLCNHEKVTEGVLEQHLEEVAYRALPAALVEKIELDVGNMRVGDSIYVKDLAIASDKDVHLMTDPETLVVSVTAVHNTVTEDTDAAAEADTETAAEAK